MKVVSLFSGAGGLDLGLIKAGHTIVWANDFDEDAVKTYKLNVGDHIVLGDIKTIKNSQIPDCDVVVGGFPCQGFSLANLKRDGSDERNTLYKEFVRVVKAKKPKCFIAENVKGILSIENGEVIKRILSDFSSLGYDVDYKLFNTANFGVPQIRQRVIIAGVKKTIGKKFPFPTPTHTKDSWVSIKSAIDHFPEPNDSADIPNHICSKYKVTIRNFTGHRKTDPDKPSPTVLARGNGKGGVCAIPHYNGSRRLSVRESASIQTFPEKFVFVGSLNSMYRQIGNAVPVEFARKLGESLLRLSR
jgi:DNA (cytosine-5)-methyltransferase 1